MNADGTVDETGASAVTMSDALAQHAVTVDKVSATDGATEVAGAELTITGKTVEGNDITPVSWTSTDEAHEVTLPAGTYTLHEVSAPNGYKVAQDIQFTVDAKGNVVSAGKTLEGARIVMVDEKIPSSSALVNTGDVTTPVAPLLSMLAGTFMLCGIALELHDKRRRHESK